MRDFSASCLPKENFFIIVGCSPGVTVEKRIYNCAVITGLGTWNPFCKCYDTLIFHNLAKLMQFCALQLLKHREEEGKAVQCCSYSVESSVPQW